MCLPIEIRCFLEWAVFQMTISSCYFRSIKPAKYCKNVCIFSIHASTCLTLQNPSSKMLLPPALWTSSFKSLKSFKSSLTHAQPVIYDLGIILTFQSISGKSDTQAFIGCLAVGQMKKYSDDNLKLINHKKWLPVTHHTVFCWIQWKPGSRPWKYPFL